jgi:hypothetical protein
MSAPVEPSTANSMNGTQAPYAGLRTQGRRVITQHTAEGDCTIRTGNGYRPLARTTVGTLLSVILALQVTGCTSGKSAEAPESPATSTPSTTSPATTQPAQVAAAHPEASPVAAAAAMSKPTEEDLTRLAKEVEAKKSAHLAELQKSGGFMIAGEIKRRTKDSLIIWGVAANWSIAKDSQEGIMYESGNIIVRNYNEERISGTYYQPQVHYFIEQTDGKNAFGASVAINVYGDEPAKQKAKRLAYAEAQRRYDEMDAIVHPPAPPAPVVVIPRYERIFPIVNKVAEKNGLKIDKPLSDSKTPETATWSSEAPNTTRGISIVKVVATKPNTLQFEYAWDYRLSLFSPKDRLNEVLNETIYELIDESIQQFNDDLGMPPYDKYENMTKGGAISGAVTWEEVKKSPDIMGDQIFTGSGYRLATPEELGTPKATMKEIQLGECRITGGIRAKDNFQFLSITVEFKP